MRVCGVGYTHFIQDRIMTDIRLSSCFSFFLSTPPPSIQTPTHKHTELFTEKSPYFFCLIKFGEWSTFSRFSLGILNRQEHWCLVEFQGRVHCATVPGLLCEFRWLCRESGGVSECVCVCVRERESSANFDDCAEIAMWWLCACVCERERDSARERERGRGRAQKTKRRGAWDREPGVIT